MQVITLSTSTGVGACNSLGSMFLCASEIRICRQVFLCVKIKKNIKNSEVVLSSI
jgi:hypothetical protein